MRPAGSRTASRPDSFGTTRRDLQRDHAITRSRVEERGNARAVLRATARNQLWLLGHHLVVPPPTATPSRGGLALCTRLARTDYGGDLVLPPPLPPLCPSVRTVPLPQPRESRSFFSFFRLLGAGACCLLATEKRGKGDHTFFHPCFMEIITRREILIICSILGHIGAQGNKT